MTCRGLLVLLTCSLVSCGEDIDGEQTDCRRDGCQDGFHCNTESARCDADCSAESCAGQGQACNPDTGLCEFDCTLSGCESGWLCDTETRQCVESCLYWSCFEGFHCNETTELCDENCTEDSCEETERCNLETGLCEPLVAFADANLERCVRERIGMAEGTIRPEDLASVPWLECPDHQIRSLGGIEHMTGLVELTLWENQVSDIGPLAGLTGLTSLQLGNNAIVDIAPLSGLTALTRLGLADNQIADIGPLSGLTALRWLNIDDNPITTASALAGLTNLTWLTLDDTGIDTVRNPTLMALTTAGCEVYPGWDHASSKEGALPDEIGGLTVDPSAFDPNRRPRLNFTLTDEDEVVFDYLIGGQSVAIFREYPGGIYLEGERFVYRLAGHEIPIGRIHGRTIDLCSGDFSGVCQLSFGSRGGPAGLDPALLDSGDAIEPVFSANLTFTGRGPALRPKEGEEAPYGAIFNLLDPYVLASPNQFDAGSCLFMATTGAMEILMNQHTPIEDIQYDGDTDLSERYLMNAVDRAPSTWVPRSTTDALFAFNYFGGALLNRDYRFTAGYVRDTSTGVVAADPDDEGAYFSCYYNWLDELPENFEEMLVPTPEVDRTFVFLPPVLNQNSVWNVGLMDDDTVARILWEIRTKRTPVLVIYNHYMYWHSDLIVGYDDTRLVGNCRMVQDSLEYFEDQGATSYVNLIEDHMEELGGCMNHGVLYVRDSIYDGGSDELMYNYSDVYNFSERYSNRIIQRDYDWLRYLSNHAYTVQRR